MAADPSSAAALAALTALSHSLSPALFASTSFLGPLDGAAAPAAVGGVGGRAGAPCDDPNHVLDAQLKSQNTFKQDNGVDFVGELGGPTAEQARQATARAPQVFEGGAMVPYARELCLRPDGCASFDRNPQRRKGDGHRCSTANVYQMSRYKASTAALAQGDAVDQEVLLGPDAPPMVSVTKVGQKSHSQLRPVVVTCKHLSGKLWEVLQPGVAAARAGDIHERIAAGPHLRGIVKLRVFDEALRSVRGRTPPSFVGGQLVPGRVEAMRVVYTLVYRLPTEHRRGLEYIVDEHSVGKREEGWSPLHSKGRITPQKLVSNIEGVRGPLAPGQLAILWSHAHLPLAGDLRCLLCRVLMQMGRDEDMQVLSGPMRVQQKPARIPPLGKRTPLAAGAQAPPRPPRRNRGTKRGRRGSSSTDDSSEFHESVGSGQGDADSLDGAGGGRHPPPVRRRGTREDTSMMRFHEMRHNLAPSASNGPLPAAGQPRHCEPPLSPSDRGVGGFFDPSPSSLGCYDEDREHGEPLPIP